VSSSPYLTVQEVAELARCEHRIVRRAIKSSAPKASLIGGRWIVRDTAVEDWIEVRANGPSARPSAPPAGRQRSRPGRPCQIAW
jgi:excisionase family DNA binding protein